MKDLKIWENKIKMKRSKTVFRDFVKEIGSFIPIVLYKWKLEVSRYPDTDRIKVIHTKEFVENRDNYLKSWIDYDFELNFWDNYEKLIKITGWASTLKDPTSENAEFAEAVWKSKNVYLSILVITNCENIAYTFYAQENVKNTLNSVMVWENSEIVYFSTAVIKSFKVFYSRYIVWSNNIWFSSNLIWCSECIFCDNLINQSYNIENKQYSKEEYEVKKREILSNKKDFQNFYSRVNKNAININSENIVWEFCVNSVNIENWYFCYRLQNARNTFFVGHENGRKNVLDTMCSDEDGFWDIYWCSNLGTAQNAYMSDAFIWANLYYCFDLINCTNCLWCRSLNNKSFCIFNKQYTKEEWFILADKILAQMDKDWLLWERISPKLCPFYFNDTMAYLIDDSFTKEEVEEEWYMWRDEKIKIDIPEWVELVFTSQLAIENNDLKNLSIENKNILNDFQWYDVNWKWQINKEILSKVIIDENWNYYKIIWMEYDFLMKYWLPLPDIHWLDRIKIWIKFK